MNQPRILIVEDDPDVRAALKRILAREGYEPDEAVHGLDALRILGTATYDLVLLDLRMEPVGGIEVLKAARQRDPDLIVIIITGHGSLDSAVEALRLGAFDYLFKPFAVKIVAQRVREGLQVRTQALRRRRLVGEIDHLRHALEQFETEATVESPPAATRRFIQSGDLVIDEYHRTATLGDRLLDLTTTEFDLLLCLVRASPVVLSPRELLACSLGYGSGDFEARELVKWHIYHLRRKIEPDPANPRYIKNIRYKGYVWAGS